MALEALGAAEARHLRDCLSLVDAAHGTGQLLLDLRLVVAATRLVEASPGLADRCALPPGKLSSDG